MTAFHEDPSAQAPWTMTTVGLAWPVVAVTLADALSAGTNARATVSSR
jgi:hypothetical protein